MFLCVTTPELRAAPCSLYRVIMVLRIVIQQYGYHHHYYYAYR